jgi:ribosomal protein S18 acetylase RimI-like enzyme
MIEILEIQQVDEVVLTSVNRLLPQLSNSAKPIDVTQLKKLAESECTRLYFAKEGTEVLGMLSLVVFPIPTGIKAWIEDVVVDERARGKGIGKALMEKALVEAGSLGSKSIDLTSRPTRVAANELYQAIGYQKRETNVYRYKIS